jgi:hypothetical protein
MDTPPHQLVAVVIAALQLAELLERENGDGLPHHPMLLVPPEGAGAAQRSKVPINWPPATAALRMARTFSTGGELSTRRGRARRA